MADGGETCGLVILVVADGGAGARDRLVAALSVARIASVIIAPPEGGTLTAAVARPLVTAAQAAGAAALVLGDARLARTLEADGVHVPWSADVEQAAGEARQIVGRQAIVGADAGALRHDAMCLGETMADYVAFGPVPSREERLERVAWWAEIFEVPCVALDVATGEEAAALSRAGADFVAVTLEAGRPPAEAAETIAAIAAALRTARAIAGGSP